MGTRASLLVEWQAEKGRHDLPWQIDRTPYRVWVSEIMLQQTQVATVCDYFIRFMAAFPAVSALAAASLDEVFALWSGLGYYRRAKHLHQAAIQIDAHHSGALPNNVDDLCALPGIGPSTAGAILSLGFDAFGVILDGNVKRVLSRVFSVPGPYNAKTLKTLWGHAKRETPAEHAGVYNQGIMDLGSTVCLRQSPLCGLCPWHKQCDAFEKNTVHLYPSKFKKPRVPTYKKTVWIHEYQGALWLFARPMSGIWGGLLSFRMSDGWEKLDKDMTGSGFSNHPLPNITHRFTHQVWDIKPVWVVWQKKPFFEDVSGVWHDPLDAISLGLPKPIRDLLDQYVNGCFNQQPYAV